MYIVAFMLFMYANLYNSQNKFMIKYYYPHFMDEKTEKLKVKELQRLYS